MMRRRAMIWIVLVLLAVQPVPSTASVRAATAAYELIYLYRDESVEATQAFTLAAVDTKIGADTQHILQRFPINGIAVPWDVRPPAALSPDGKTLAMIQWDEHIGRALLLDAKGNSARTLPGIKVTGLFTPTVLGWTLDGKRLLIYDESRPPGKVLTYTLDGDSLQTLFELPDDVTGTGVETLSPDTSRLVYCTQLGNRGCAGYAIRSMPDGAKVTLALPRGIVCAGFPALKWAPDSSTIALGCMTGPTAFSIQVADAHTGNVTSYPMPFEVNDFAWSVDGRQLMIDLCSGNYINAEDPDCGALKLLSLTDGKLSEGPAIERTEARRLFWQGDTVIFNESTGGGQEATMYFYDIPTKQSKQFTRNASTYADASFIVFGLRPAE